MSTFMAAARTAARVATLALGWRPNEFWAATPQDLVTALGLDEGDDATMGGAPLDGALLARMMEVFPDE